MSILSIITTIAVRGCSCRARLLKRTKGNTGMDKKFLFVQNKLVTIFSLYSWLEPSYSLVLDRLGLIALVLLPPTPLPPSFSWFQNSSLALRKTRASSAVSDIPSFTWKMQFCCWWCFPECLHRTPDHWYFNYWSRKECQPIGDELRDSIHRTRVVWMYLKGTMCLILHIRGDLSKCKCMGQVTWEASCQMASWHSVTSS